jgi:hypothetical protein
MGLLKMTLERVERAHLTEERPPSARKHIFVDEEGVSRDEVQTQASQET